MQFFLGNMLIFNSISNKLIANITLLMHHLYLLNNNKKKQLKSNANYSE